ncbi:hypothetical protein BX616_005174, partial [Lobosporangium transversale]
MGRDGDILPPSDSESSEVQLETFAEGELLEAKVSNNKRWNSISSHHYSTTHLCGTGARCSSSTLFDEARPLSGYGSWPKPEGSDSQKPNLVLTRPISTFEPQQNQIFNSSMTRQSLAIDDLKFQKHYKNHQSQDHDDSALSSTDQTQTAGDSFITNLYTNISAWDSTTQLKVQASRPVQSTPRSKDCQSFKDSLPFAMSTAPLTPTPVDLDKSAKNLMIFNQIPRQWPSSQETLRLNIVAKANKKFP